MARLRWPVARSDMKTVLSTYTGRPQYLPNIPIRRETALGKILAFNQVAVATAPELTIGLNGRFEASSSTMALNASPVGSTPTFDNT